ncbi:MAG: hypothetical protein SGPRY_006508 [Prymnesium sp.]
MMPNVAALLRGRVTFKLGAATYDVFGETYHKWHLGKVSNVPTAANPEYVVTCDDGTKNTFDEAELRNCIDIRVLPEWDVARDSLANAFKYLEDHLTDAASVERPYRLGAMYAVCSAACAFDPGFVRKLAEENDAASFVARLTDIPWLDAETIGRMTKELPALVVASRDTSLSFSRKSIADFSENLFQRVSTFVLAVAKTKINEYDAQHPYEGARAAWLQGREAAYGLERKCAASAIYVDAFGLTCLNKDEPLRGSQIGEDHGSTALHLEPGGKAAVLRVKGTIAKQEAYQECLQWWQATFEAGVSIPLAPRLIFPEPGDPGCAFIFSDAAREGGTGYGGFTVVRRGGEESPDAESTMLYMAELWDNNTRRHLQSNRLLMPAGEAIGFIVLIDAIARELSDLTHLVTFTDSAPAAAAINTSNSPSPQIDYLAWLSLYGLGFLILSKDKLSSASLAAAPDAGDMRRIDSSVRIVFLRHGESQWNKVFNRGFGPSFLLRLLSSLLHEVWVLPFADSDFIDSPLSDRGIEQCEGLRLFLSRPHEQLDQLASSDLDALTGSGGSLLVSSQLRRAVATLVLALSNRLRASALAEQEEKGEEGGKGERVLLHSSCQEISRNFDTLSISSPLQPPDLGSQVGIEALGVTLDASVNLGNKTLAFRGIHRLQHFAEWATSLKGERTIVLGGHSLWFRSFFQVGGAGSLLPPSRVPPFLLSFLPEGWASLLAFALLCWRSCLPPPRVILPSLLLAPSALCPPPPPSSSLRLPPSPSASLIPLPSASPLIASSPCEED